MGRTARFILVLALGGGAGILEPAAVREGVGRRVEDAHHERAGQERDRRGERRSTHEQAG